MPLLQAGRRNEVRGRSQDTSSIALVSPERLGALLRKEKDEASLRRECGTGFAECLHFRFAGVKVFLFSQSSNPALVSQQKPVRWNLFNGQP